MTDILVVDDDTGMREFLEIMLTQEGYQVKCAKEGKEALEFCKVRKFDLAITDLKMPKLDGIEFLKRIKDVSPETMVIMITAYASGETAVTAMQEGAYDYIEKNFDVEDIKKRVRDALNKKGIKKEDALFIKGVKDSVSFGNLIGKSKEILKIYSLINKVADTTANILILGESGTGKELVAQAIHDTSSRKENPFVVINCGGIPGELLESELFGYMKGAFTSAFADKPGLLEVAAGGTIFLDEIAELPTILQVKLLRVIQERAFRRLGGSKDIKVDVRIIAATNKDLKQKVKDGSFREDLYYRLNVIPIYIPPLRERREDIPILTDYFIRKYSKEFGKELRNISSYAMELLMKYRFPGNVRELENIIEKSVALETSNIILPESLGFSDFGEDADKDPVLTKLGPEGIKLDEVMEKIEKEYVESAMKMANGSKQKATRLLGISMRSLRYRLEKLGLRL
ncbi:MAG: sigma-54-dependent Fis family transcriptional regulator [Deltaproteobacteria bacterium]|nr:sigma-54-dependent Fis family transcriptional regulator [Deltaproteobacteria bacterium]